MEKILKNGYIVKKRKYISDTNYVNAVELECYFPSGKIFEKIICLEEQTEDYIHSWEKLYV